MCAFVCVLLCLCVCVIDCVCVVWPFACVWVGLVLLMFVCAYRVLNQSGRNPSDPYKSVVLGSLCRQCVILFMVGCVCACGCVWVWLCVWFVACVFGCVCVRVCVCVCVCCCVVACLLARLNGPGFARLCILCVCVG